MDLTFFYSNVRSLAPKIHDLNNYISIYKPKIIALTETWLDNNIPTSFVCPQNYIAYRKDRNTGKGGGCIILVHDTVISKPVTVFTPDMDYNIKIDAVACRFPLAHGDNMGFLCIYRPPGLNIVESSSLYDILKKILNFNYKFNIIIGDFNFPDIQWPGSASSSQSESFLNYVHDNFLQQHVTSFTRKASKSILDLVFSTQGTTVNNLAINEEFSKSDHSIIDFSVPIRPTLLKRRIKRRNLAKADWPLFRQLLLSSFSNVQHALRLDDINEVWANFVSILHSALDAAAPIHEVSTRNFISCSKVRTALRYKRRRFKELVKHNTPSNIITYTRAVEIVKRTTLEDINSRESRLLNHPEAKIFWSYVNKRIAKQNIINSLNFNGSEVDDPDDFPNIFNDYFASVFAPASDLVIQEEHQSSHSLNNILITAEEVNKVLKSLPSRSSADNDNLSYKILKEGDFIIADYLAKLFTLSMDLNRLPSAWKIAIISPIHKSGSRSIVSNYRPISVNSCCCRVLERIVRNKINNFLYARRIIADTQHGFVSGRSIYRY